MIYKTCEVCQEQFFKKVNCSKKEWSKRKFCNYACKSKSQKGKTAWNKGLTKETSEAMKRVSESKLGDKNSSKRPEVRLKISETQKGRELDEKHWAWKSDNVGYVSLHSWVRRRLGTPSVCKHCGTTESKRYEWANISGSYKRNLKDWIRLCKSCHNKYDDIYKKIWKSRRSSLHN